MANGTCHAWIQKYINGKNITLDFLNELHVKRNFGGITMLTIFSVIGVIGNAHVLYVYFRYFKYSNYRIYVLFLGILDFINCGFAAPLVVFYLLYPLNYPSHSFCKIFRTILYFMAIASTLLLVSIAIERFRKIRYPLKERLSATAVKGLCIGSLVGAAVLSWPAPIIWGLGTVETGILGFQGKRCFTEDRFQNYNTNYQGIYNACLILFYFIVSATLMVMYIYIGIKIHTQYERDSSRRDSLQPGTFNCKESIKSNKNNTRKSTITLCVVTFTYVLSALPHHMLSFFIFLIPDFDCSLSLIGSQLYYTFVWSYFFNSVVNPFIYGIRDRKFRLAVKNIYKRKC